MVRIRGLLGITSYVHRALKDTFQQIVVDTAKYFSAQAFGQEFLVRVATIDARDSSGYHILVLRVEECGQRPADRAGVGGSLAGGRTKLQTLPCSASPKPLTATLLLRIWTIEAGHSSDYHILMSRLSIVIKVR